MNIIEKANKAAEQFNAAMAELFPSYMAKAVVSTNLGGALVVSFANVASVEDAMQKLFKWFEKNAEAIRSL